MSSGSSRSQMFLIIPSIHRKTTVLEVLINKVADLTACNFINDRLQQRCFPMNITKFLRAAFRTPSMVAAYPLHVITRFDSSIEKMKRLRAIKVHKLSVFYVSSTVLTNLMGGLLPIP